MVEEQVSGPPEPHGLCTCALMVETWLRAPLEAMGKESMLMPLVPNRYSAVPAMYCMSAENGDPGTAVNEPLEAAEYAFISYLPLLGLLGT